MSFSFVMGILLAPIAQAGTPQRPVVGLSVSGAVGDANELRASLTDLLGRIGVDVQTADDVAPMSFLALVVVDGHSNDWIDLQVHPKSGPGLECHVSRAESPALIVETISLRIQSVVEELVRASMNPPEAPPSARAERVVADAEHEPPPSLPQGTALPSTPPEPAAHRGVRLLWGAGLHGGVGHDEFAVAPAGYTLLGSPCNGVCYSTFQPGLGLYGRLGAQLNDSWGAEGELSLGTSINSSDVRGAATADFTPFDWFTFALGPLVRIDGEGYCGGEPTCPDVTAFGATARADFHLAISRSQTSRSAITVGLVGDLGRTIGGNPTISGYGLASGGYVTIGYTHY